MLACASELLHLFIEGRAAQGRRSQCDGSQYKTGDRPRFLRGACFIVKNGVRSKLNLEKDLFLI
jgi:hypothetical protein